MSENITSYSMKHLSRSDLLRLSRERYARIDTMLDTLDMPYYQQKRLQREQGRISQRIRRINGRIHENERAG